MNGDWGSYRYQKAVLKTCLKEVIRSGDYIVGHEQIMQAIEAGNVGMVVVAYHAEEPYKSQILLATLSKHTKVRVFRGTPQELGETCGMEHLNSIVVLDDVINDIISNLGGN
ncbi:Hypothetical predicted protein [Drosophila guanche]|uniref:Ribosomal protein eL8/eL30/eS12/Gadd45 domain-containing protein n=1 Tax=Drosophila guanche TaxID=7266 RepID=A0A3B0K5P2_DROGU|nr:Hypothetical predicted protein [Drosophila guanche]